MPTSTAAAAATPTSARRRQATSDAPTTATISAAKLDCENEIRNPSQSTTIAATATNASRAARAATSSTRPGTIATTRNRPYTDGSQNTELTRKNCAYAFAVITFGFWKMSRVSY